MAIGAPTVVDQAQLVKICQETRSHIEKAEKAVAQQKGEAKLDSKQVLALISDLKECKRTIELSLKKDPNEDLEPAVQTLIFETLRIIDTFAEKYHFSVGAQQKTGASVNALFFKLQDLIKSLHAEKNMYEIEETHKSSGDHL